METSQHAEPIDAVGFVSAAPSHAVVKIGQFLIGAYQRASQQPLSIQLDPSIKNWLRKLEGQRVIICPNHCAHDDPLVAFAISRQADEEFYFMTAREIFMWHPSLRSQWLRHLGCYSVVRAGADIEAFKYTCDLLVKNNKKVVIFPEGEVTHQNRFLTSLESGVERIAIAAAARLEQLHKEPVPVFILPVGIAYRYNNDILRNLSSILDKQERKLGITYSDMAIEQRLVRAYNAMLNSLAREYNYCDDLDKTVGDRIERFLSRTVAEIAAECSAFVPNMSYREQLHYIKRVFINRRYSRRGTVVSDDERLSYKRLRRAINLVALSDDSFRQVSSIERLAELILILEHEVSGHISLRASRTAYVACSKPIDVRDFASLLHHDRRAAIAAMGHALSDSINDALLYLQAAHPEHTLAHFVLD